jgi:hypothetical protein
VALSLPLAHAVCLGLVAADQLTKTWRIQVLARGLNCPLGFRYVFTVNVASDAAASLTPLRVGGEPVRVAGLLQGGLSVADTMALIGVEGTMEYLTVIAFAVLIVSAYGAEWWATTRGHLIPAAHRAIPWVVLFVVLGLLVWALLRRVAPRLSMHVHGTLRTTMRTVLRMPIWAVALSIPLTIIHVVARIAILPMLMLTLAAPPLLGAVWVGSFALLYGQLFVPTPSGAGAVELGFLDGAAGDAGPDATGLLVAWRFYTTITGVILGLAFGVPHYGTRARRWLLRRRGVRANLGDGSDA